MAGNQQPQSERNVTAFSINPIHQGERRNKFLATKTKLRSYAYA